MKLRTVLLLQSAAGVAVLGALAAGVWLRSRGLTPDEWFAELRRGETPRFEWQSIEKKHWQAISGSPGETAERTDLREGNSAGCPPGMVRVKGAYRSELHGAATGEIERLQDAACTDWISRDFPARCRTFDREKIAAEIAKLPTTALDFCIDRFEYPNVFGQNPMIVTTFHEAEAICQRDQRRLCTENEWTFACEGEEAQPYPYGYTRDETACVIDRPWRPFSEGALQPRDGKAARDELDRLWQGEPSGSRGACKSPFGVYDMTGNVDEWTRNVNPTGYASVLKGGYWGPVRARCRPATRAHNEDFIAYQQSFRCCADANTSVPAPRGAPPTSVLADAGPAPPPALGSSAPLAGLEPELPLREDSSDDEIDAITLAKTRIFHCAAGAAPAKEHGLAALGPALLAIARRRRRDKRPVSRSVR